MINTQIKHKPHKVQARQGFNLVELLIAMTVIMTIVGLACIIFTESDEAWYAGISRAESTAAGRAAISLISHDLQHAVADERRTFILRPDTAGSVSYGFQNDEICFVSLQHSGSDTNRVAREIYYWVRKQTNDYERYELVRGYHTITNIFDTTALDNCYWNTNWFANRPDAGETGVLAENVAAVAFLDHSGNNLYSSQTNTNQLPDFVDIFIELLDKRAARRAAALPSPAKEKYVEKNARRYTTRVYLQNRYEYRK
ncbi:MAG: PulJ/GspJ family protein [Alphaproteobacteria bacterium]